MKKVIKTHAAKIVILGSALLWGLNAHAESVTAVLAIKPKIEMSELARRVSDPSSPRFQKFFTPAEVRELTAPSDAQYNQQVAVLRSNGFEIVSESKTHLWLSVRADRKTFEKSLYIKSKVTASLGLGFIANITGLEKSAQRRSNIKLKKLPWSSAGSEGLTPDQIKSFYGFDQVYAAGINGLGQDIAIATYDDFNLSDVQTYFQNINSDPMSTVEQIKFNGNPSPSDDSIMETTMDAEFAGMIAPGAALHVFTSAANNDTAEAQMFTAILDDNRSKIINYSWSSCEAQEPLAHRQVMAQIFQRAVAQGVNVFVASGDAGATACHADTTLQPGWPSTDPNVISVGGTTLQASDGTYIETAWGPCGGVDGCSGGGISISVPSPSYQKNLPAPFNVTRSYPDVAFNSDLMQSGEPIWVTYTGDTTWFAAGGTSMAAPHWCGLMALINQSRQALGRPALGFLNPIIYGLSPDQRNAVLTDIVTGSNGQYNAGIGWDAVTGWGTPKAGALVELLKRYGLPF